MPRLISLLLLATCLIGGPSSACEKHLKGHAGGSDTGNAIGGR